MALTEPGLHGATVGTGGEQPVQDGEEDSAFGIEPEAAVSEGLADGVAAAGTLPQRLEHEAGADHAGIGPVGEGAAGGREDGGLAGEASAGGESAIGGVGVAETVEAAEAEEDLLANLGAVPLSGTSPRISSTKRNCVENEPYCSPPWLTGAGAVPRFRRLLR